MRLAYARACEARSLPERRERQTCSEIIEVSTTGWDPDREGVGATWMAGSPFASRLFVPQDPTEAPYLRYLFALCGHRVPSGATHRLIGFRQKLEIGVQMTTAAGDLIVKEIPVTTPDWAFPDGNVVWCFRYLPGKRQVPRSKAPIPVLPSRTQNPYGAFSALLDISGLAAFGSYVPPSSGQPPGYPVEGIGTIYDVRNPWTDPTDTMTTLLKGPGDLIMYASVWQTDPSKRPVFLPPPGYDVGSLAPEDRFALANPFARYRHVAGAMQIEVE